MTACNSIRVLLVAALFFGLAGCLRDPSPLDFPAIDSGEIDILRGPGKGSVRLLSGHELDELSTWLKAHREGWRYALETPPSTEAIILLRLADRRSLSLMLFKNCFSCAKWNTNVMISGAGPEDGAMHEFSREDFAVIRGLVYAP